MSRTGARTGSSERQQPGVGRLLATGACLFLLFAPASALAVTPEASEPEPLPGFALVEESEPADPLYFVNLSEGFRPQFDALRPPVSSGRIHLSGFRHRSVKVIHYSTPLKLNQNEFIMTVDAPGMRSTVVSVEFEF